MSSQSLTLNHRHYSEADLWAKAELILNAPDSPAWQLSLWTFIQEWLSSVPYVTVHTSGSTGRPKPIRIRKEQMVHSALATGQYFKLKQGDTALLCLPCHYIAGRMMVVRALVLGLDLISVPPSGNPMEGVGEEVAFAAMVPMQVDRVLGECPEKMKLLRTLIIGGAPVGRDLYKQLQCIPISAYATYGMTETVTHIAVKRLNGMAKHSFYHPLPGVTFSTDERGCLVIHAHKVADEPVVTNDVVRLFLPPGKFEWLGRYGNVINSGGVKIHTEEVEQKLVDLLDCRFFVAGLPHPQFGEQVVLVLEGLDLSDDEKQGLLTNISSLLERYEIPKQILVVPRFAETETGKVKRGATLLPLE